MSWFCHRTAGKRQKLQYLKNFFLFQLSVQKNHLLKRQYGKHLLVSVLSLSAATAVAKQKSNICTANQNLGQQYRSDNSCSRLSTRQSYSQKVSYELSTKFSTDSSYENYLVFYCRTGSRNSQKQDINCRPRSRSKTMLIKI